MTLTGEATEAILTMEIEVLTSKTGFKNFLNELDKMYLTDESSQASEAYEAFEKFLRSKGVSISDCVIKFEQLYFNTNLGGGGNFTPCWFSLNNSETVTAVTLAFCSIQ